jgi:hypothetical protein
MVLGYQYTVIGSQFSASPAGPCNDPAVDRQDRERPWSAASFRALPVRNPVRAAPGGV